MEIIVVYYNTSLNTNHHICESEQSNDTDDELEVRDVVVKSNDIETNYENQRYPMEKPPRRKYIMSEETRKMKGASMLKAHAVKMERVKERRIIKEQLYEEDKILLDKK